MFVFGKHLVLFYRLFNRNEYVAFAVQICQIKCRKTCKLYTSFGNIIIIVIISNIWMSQPKVTYIILNIFFILITDGGRMSKTIVAANVMISTFTTTTRGKSNTFQF